MTSTSACRWPRFAETVTVTAQAIDADTSSAEAQLVERKNAHVITDNVGVAGDAAERRQRRRRRHVARDGLVGRRQPVRLRARPRRALQQHHARRLGAADDRAGQEGRAARPVPDRAHRQRAGRQVVLAGQLGGVRRRPRADRAAEVAEPSGVRPLVRRQLLSRRPPARRFRSARSAIATGSATTTARGRCRAASRTTRSCAAASTRRTSASRRTRSPRSAGCSDNTWRPAARGRRAGTELGRGVRRPVRQAGRDRQRDALLQGAVRRGRTPLLPHRRRATTSKRSATTTCSPARRRRSSASSATSRISSRRATGSRFENFYTHTGRDEGRIFQGPTPRTTRVLPNYRLQFIEEGLLSNAVGGEHFFQGLSNSRIDWRVNYARAKRDEPDLREMLYQAPLARRIGCSRRVPFTLADESQSGFRMFNKLDDDTLDVGGQLEHLQHGGRPADAVQVRRELRRSHARLPVAALPLHPVTTQQGRPGGLPFNLTLTPEQLYAPSNIGTAFRFNEETRPVDAYDGEQTTTAGYGMVDLALSSEHAARRRRARRAVRPGGQHVRPVRPVRRARSPRRTRTPTCSPA